MIKNYAFSDLLSEVKTRLNESVNDGLWTTTELNSLINHAMLRVAMDTRIPRSDVVIPVQQNVSFYQSFPSDLLLPLDMTSSALWGSLRLFPSFILSLDKMYGGMYLWEKDSSNTSQIFVPFSFDSFILWPAPSATTTVTLHYMPRPTTLMNSGDTTTFPLVAQKLVPIFASYLAQLKNDMDKAQLFLKEYKQRLISAQELTRHKDASRPTVMAPGRSFDRSNANPAVRAYRNSNRYY